MNIFLGSDHRGFELKNMIRDWLVTEGHDVIDCGNKILDLDDDDVVFADVVSEKVLENPSVNLGIVLCGSGVAVSITANRRKGIYCGLGFDKKQIEQARSHDHINILALPADYISIDQAKGIVLSFLNTQLNMEEKYSRRLNKMDSL